MYICSTPPLFVSTDTINSAGEGPDTIFAEEKKQEFQFHSILFPDLQRQAAVILYPSSSRESAIGKVSSM